MKNLFYSTRLDKAGNKLMTSYTSAVSAKKYGGSDSTHAETLYFVRFREDGGANVNENVDGPVVRSLLVNTAGTGADSGRFVLWGKRNDSWERTPFSFSQYGNANTAMKAMIGMYQALMIVTSADESESDEAAMDRWEGALEVTGEV